ncbi:salt tolerance down-regulator-domain-containing protein [Coniochaeta sp. 2T2.1]|nr:salt tolerance down-regulator-domain-containing protein [Coniochaeta sp. 2T2.1]
MVNHRQQPPAGAAPPPPPSPNAKAMSKYTNKDGSKVITLPKANSSTTGSAQPSPSLDSPYSKNAAQSGPGAPGSPASTQPLAVNRKKQKRREKEAQKRALAEQAVTKEHPPSPTDSAAPSHDRRSLDVEHDFSEGEQEHDHLAAQENGTGDSARSAKSKKKKKRVAGAGGDDTQSHHSYYDHHDYQHAPHPPPAHRVSGNAKEKIWNTSNQEERRRIKEFWLGLGEDERKSLVKVEKDAVLKKMKEQQKHTCSCTVCGRKRTAIEEELEGLYDAYYEELEQYAHQPNQNGEGPPMMGSPKPPVGSSRGPPSNYPHPPLHSRPSHGRIVEHVGDDESEEYSSEAEPDDDDDDHYDDNAPPEGNSRNHYPDDFFTFGNSLTVQGRGLPILPSFLQNYPANVPGSSSLGGILTVADDLLKNDGRKFIEMMEQLAERRMAREEEAKEAYRNYGPHSNGGAYGHHPPPEEEEYDDDEEEEEEYDDDEEEYDSQEEEQDPMTDEQRMEEGRRMFQIFAARMFEQRVLTAYKEMVAKERQQKLIEEEDEEKNREEQRRAKKAKDAQKRKDKAAKKKELLAKQKAEKEAEKAAEEAARKEEEERKAAEQRQKAEEKRKKKEAQKKAEEEEKARKEAKEREKRAKEEAAKQKEKEAKEREKKAKEEAAKQKEREAKERKELQEREKKEREAKSKAEREAAGKAAQEQQKPQKPPKQPAPVVQKATTAPPAATPITVVKRPAQHPKATAVPALPQQPPAAVAAAPSPQIAIATPALPKAPLTMRNRQPSQQESTSGSSQSTAQSESNPSQAPSPHPLTPSHPSPGPLGPNSKPGVQQLSHGTSPMNIPPKTNMTPLFGGFPSSPMMSFGHPPLGMSQQPPPGFPSPMYQNPGFPSPFQPYGSPGTGVLAGGMSRSAVGRPFAHTATPPGFNGAHDSPFPGMAQGFPSGPARDTAPLHQRQPSLGGFEHQSPSVAAAQPIGKPMPIGRPPSVAPGQRPAASLPNPSWSANDTENRQLGSKALLEDSEEAILPSTRRNTSIPGPGYSTHMFPMEGPFNAWPSPVGQPSYFGSSPPASHPLQAVPWGTPGQMVSAFGPQNGSRQNHGRSAALRQLLCQVSRKLAESQGPPTEDRLEGGFVSLTTALNLINQIQPQYHTDIGELMLISETLGDAANGGGSFETVKQSDNTYVRWKPEPSGPEAHPLRGAIGARVPGQIGSAAVGSGYGTGQGGI